MKKQRIELYDDGIGSVEYVDHMGSDLTIVNSARVSFGKQKMTMDKRDEKLIKYLIENRHTSTLEHNVVTFRFCVPLFVRSQHHRHRTWSYNEISRRYTDADIRFYQPSSLRTQHESNRQASNNKEMIDPLMSYPRSIYPAMTATESIRTHNRASLELFNRLTSAGVCREQARGILPQNMYTEYYGTVNFNNLLKFIDLRSHSGAQLEIQKVANACEEIALSLWPITMNSYREAKSE